MIRNQKLRTYLPLLFTAGISCALFCVLLGLRGFYPFGARSVMFTDMYDECVPALYRFYDIVTGRKNIFYEFQASGGINLYTETINELCNPFNYILLLWKRKHIYLAVNVLLLLYVTGAACSAHFFLIRVWRRPSGLNSLLSLCYAFSGYFAYNFQILRWMILPAVFSLFLLSLTRLYKERKGGLYAFLLGYQIVLSVQHGFMTLLFCLFTSGIWMYCMEDKKRRKELCFYVAAYTLAGLLLSAIVLLPTADTLLSSSRSGANASYFKVLAEHGLKDLFERLFQFCCPILIGILIHYLYRNLKQDTLKNLLKRPELKFTFLWNALLWLTVLLQPANLLWHMGSYVCFPVRYGYMLVLALVCFIKALENRLPEAEKTAGTVHLRELLSGAGVLILLAGAVALLKSRENGIVSGFLSLAISRAHTKEAFVVLLILALIFGAVMLSFIRGRVFAPLLGTCVLVCSYCYFNMISLPAEFGDNQELCYQMMSEEYREADKTTLSDLIQREKHNTAFPRNAALITGKSSLSGYFPTADANFQSAIDRLGYMTPWVSTIDLGGTRLSDFFFNHGFYIKKEGADVTFVDEQPLENQRRLLEMMLSGSAMAQEASSIFEIVSGDFMGVSDTESVTLDLQEPATIYLDATAAANELQITVNEEIVTPPMVQMQDSPHVLITLGTFEKGEVRISLKDSAGEPYSSEQLKLGILKENEWNEAVEQLTSLFPAEEINVSSKGIRCKLSVTENFEDGVLVLPLNAAKGWQAAADDETAEIIRIGGCFLGVAVTKGTHALELAFYPPFLKTGAVLSLFGIALAVFLTWFRGSGAFRKVLRTAPFAEKLFFIIFFGAFAAIYVIPAVGLMCSLAGRFIK